MVTNTSDDFNNNPKLIYPPKKIKPDSREYTGSFTPEERAEIVLEQVKNLQLANAKKDSKLLREAIQYAKKHTNNTNASRLIENNPDKELPQQNEQTNNLSIIDVPSEITYPAEIDEQLPALKITVQDIEELEATLGQYEITAKYKDIQKRVKLFINATEKDFRRDLNDYLKIGQNLLQKFCIEAIMGPIHDPDPDKLKAFIDKLSHTNPDLVVKLLDKLITPVKEEEKQLSGRVFAPIVINTGNTPQNTPLTIDAG